MKFVFSFTAVVVLLLFLTGCATSPVKGGLYTDVSWGTNISQPNAKATKTGKACAIGWLGMYATGDASIEAAKKNGRIKNVSYVDFQSTNILFIKVTHCTIVRGN